MQVRLGHVVTGSAPRQPRVTESNAVGARASGGRPARPLAFVTETHYSATGPEVGQPTPFAEAAREELLDWVGFTEVVWGAYLDQEADRFLILPTGQFTTCLDGVVGVSGTTVKMTRLPEDLVFQEE